MAAALSKDWNLGRNENGKIYDKQNGEKHEKALQK